MKSYALCLFITLLVCSGKTFSQKNYTVTGKISGAPDSTVVYLYRNVISEEYPLDSAYIIKGVFRFEGTIPGPMECMLYMEDDGPSSVLNFWLENSSIGISGNIAHFNEAVVTGSKSNKTYELYVKEVKNVVQKLDVEYYSDTAKSLTKQFIKKHPGSYKSVQELYLFRELISPSEEKELYALLVKEVKNSRTGKLVASHIANRNDLRIGDLAPDFTLQTADGKPVSLSSYRGKNVVLIFWGSWCAPCRLENEEYNKLFDQYTSDKANFLGIAFDTKEDMIEASKKDKIKWLNVFTSFDSPLAYKYGIMSVPHNVVINKEGKIVEMDLFVNAFKTDKDRKNHLPLSSLLKTLVKN